ncbi:MAG: hypothetical protein WBY94_05445 [Polyangiaceae bacterium]
MNHGFAIGLFGLGFVAACGGTTQGTPGGGTGAGASASSGGASSSSSSGSGSGGSSSGSGGSSSGSGSGGSSGGGPSILPVGATPGAGMVPCGGATCTAPDVCCSGGRGGPVCSSIAACNGGGNDSYTCTGNTNCTAPLICCVTYGHNGANDVAACQASCGTGDTAQVCQMDSECPAGQSYCGNGGAQGISVCEPPLIPPGTSQGTGAITCGAATCNAPDVCCSGGGGGLMCSALTACDNNGNDSYTCTGQANCAALSICCVTYAMGAQQNDIARCQPACGMANTDQVCQTDSECTGGMVCRGGGDAPKGITICRRPAMMPPVPDAGASPTGADAALDQAATPEAAADTGTATGSDAAYDAPGGG